MAVSATTWGDTPASYTSRGPEVEVSAPGGEILRSDALDRILSTWVTGGYAYLSGTSMASPQVAGLAGLLYALGVTSAQERRDLIRSTADDLGDPGWDPFFGDGRINVHAAVLAALGNPPPPPPPPQDEEAPVADFSASCTYLDCAFTDLSTDDAGVVEWEWAFGGEAVSPVQNPTHSFSGAGTYDVSLTVKDAGGRSDVLVQAVTVEDPPPQPPNEPPVASFTYSCTGLECQFTDTSTDDGGVVAWLWTFEDGTWSDEQNPTKIFPDAGTYLVELLVEDGEMSLDYASQSVDVVELPPTLFATGLKVKGKLAVDLTWTGTVKPVDLYQGDGELLAAAVPSDGTAYRHETGERGKGWTFSYYACLAGTTNCSEAVTVTF
jgi:PKD repeat protein